MVDVRCIWWQEGDLHIACQGIEELADRAGPVCLQTIRNYRQWLLKTSVHRLEDGDDPPLPDTAVVQSELAGVVSQFDNCRDARSVEVKLDGQFVVPWCPGRHTDRALADPPFVGGDDQPDFALCLFSASRVWAVSSSRLMTRLTDFRVGKSSASSMRQTGVCAKRMPKCRSITVTACLSVHCSMPKPCLVGLGRGTLRNCASASNESPAGRPSSGEARSASMFFLSTHAFQVHSVGRAIPAASMYFLPASNRRPVCTLDFPRYVGHLRATNRR